MIKVNNISKSFGAIKALKDVSFTIKEAEIFGLLGPNGAGKSTTINILNTLLQPDKGEIIIDGLPNKEERKLNIGMVPQEIALYEDLSAYDNLLFWGSLYNIHKDELKKRILEALKLVGLLDRKNDRIKTYSGGMKRRINIASSILHKPKILLMDEPTVGVDPQSRNHVFEVIEKLNSEGMTIIYTTHYMEEAERLCDTIAIIDLGTIVALGTFQELKKVSNATDLLSIKLADLKPILETDIFKKIPSLKLNNSTNTLEVACENISSEISIIINKIQNAGGVIKSIDTQTANLESVFLKLTGKQLRD
ncbi:MAG: ABC transporter ATP-binding protein [Cellulophaga sp.]